MWKRGISRLSAPMKKIMKEYTREQLLKRFKICSILGIFFALVMSIGPLVIAGDFSIGVLLMYAGIFLVMFICYPIIFLGLSFNWKKFLKGYILPIPILSAFIEYIKSIVYGIKAVIAIIKKKDVFVVGKNK